MNKQAYREKMWRIWESAQVDIVYQKLENEATLLEQQLEAYEEVIPAYVQDTIREYLAKCEEMNWRVVEISCSMNQEAASEKK